MWPLWPIKKYIIYVLTLQPFCPLIEGKLQILSKQKDPKSGVLDGGYPSPTMQLLKVKMHRY